MLNRAALSCLVLAASAIVTTPAGAQVTTKSSLTATTGARCSIDGDRQGAVCACRPTGEGYDCKTAADQLSELTDHATTKDLVAYLKQLAAAARLDDHVRFVWEGTDDDGNPVARSVLYDAGQMELAGRTLPGIGNGSAGDADYVDVLVTFLVSEWKEGAPIPARDLETLPGLATFYTSTRENNPVLEQLPAVVGKLGVLEAIAASEGPSTLAVTAPPPPMQPERREPVRVPLTVFKVYLPELPYTRATIAVRDAIVTPPTFKRIAGAATRAAERLRYTFDRVSPCAGALAASYAMAVTDTKACGNPAAAVVGNVAACQDGLKADLAAARSKILVNAQACPRDAGSIGIDPVAAVDKRFSDLVETLASVDAKGESQLRNVPRERVSFGLMTAVRFGDPTFSGVRTTVGNDGKVVEDPLPRLVTAVLVNYHPWGYDSSELVTWKDPGSVKLFAGTTLSPDFGLVLGGAYSPLKGLSVNLGYAILLTNTPKAGVKLGEEVPDGFSNDPFEMGRARSWVWGLSYSFQ